MPAATAEKRAKKLYDEGKAKTMDKARTAVYTEAAVEKCINENPEIEKILGKVLVESWKEHRWEHDTKTSLGLIDTKSTRFIEDNKICFEIHFDYTNAHKSSLADIYVGTIDDPINRTVTIKCWQRADIIMNFINENFDKYLYLSDRMAGYEGRHKKCKVPIEEFIEI